MTYFFIYISQPGNSILILLTDFLFFIITLGNIISKMFLIDKSLAVGYQTFYHLSCNRMEEITNPLIFNRKDLFVYIYFFDFGGGGGGGDGIFVPPPPPPHF